MKIDYVIKYLAQEWSKGGTRPTTMVMVKLLYLFDLFYVCDTGKLYTEWPWLFYHFGPYCTESYLALGKAVKHGFIQTDTHDSKYDESSKFQTFYLNPSENEISASEVGISLRIVTEISKTLRNVEYDPHRLLNFVYFKTGPMKSAHPQDILSFDDVSWPKIEKPSQLINLSNTKIKKARALIAKLNTQKPQITQAIEPIYDDIYERGIEALNALDSSPELALSGTASIRGLFKKG